MLVKHVAPLVDFIGAPGVEGRAQVAPLRGNPHRFHVHALHCTAIDRQRRPETPASRSASAVIGARWGRRGRVRIVGQEHGEPLRRDRDGVVGLRQLARHTGLGRMRSEGGMEGGGNADEGEHAEARGVILRRLLGVVRTVRRVWERAKLVVLSEDLVLLRAIGGRYM